MVFGLVPTTGLAKRGGEQNLAFLSTFRKSASFWDLFGRKSSHESLFEKNGGGRTKNGGGVFLRESTKMGRGGGGSP